MLIQIYLLFGEELNKKYLGYSYVDFYNKILKIPTNIISWSFIGEAFDDGSHMLQINDVDRIKLLGFKSTAHYTIKDIKYVVISRNQFEFIINEFIERLHEYTACHSSPCSIFYIFTALQN